jgi:hypothetical protein
MRRVGQQVRHRETYHLQKLQQVRRQWRTNPMTNELKPYPFDAWIDREVDTGVTYFNNLVAGLGPWSDKREKHIRNQMRLAFEAGINTRHAVRPAVKALDWRIREDHFRADTPSGVYTVGDAGGGLAIVRLADGCSLRCTFDEAKNVCEWHYLSCLEDTPAAPMPRNPTPEMRDAAVRSLDNAAQTQDPKAAHRCDFWPCDECGKGF